MILRRVIQHVKEQNWTAIAIDFAIVVIGVFVGIQVSNWNAARVEQRDARDALQRLEEDLRLTIRQAESSIAFMTESQRYADLVFDRLRECRLPEGDRDAFATGLYRLGKLSAGRLVRTTFDELRESGRLGLIGNIELRTALNDAVRGQESQDIVFRMMAARTEAQIAYIDGSVIYDIRSAIGGGATIGWQQMEIDFDAACKDRRLRAAVGAARNYTYDAIADVNRRLKKFEDLLAMIQKERAQ